MPKWLFHPELLPFVISWEAWATFGVGLAAVAGAYRIGIRQIATLERQTDILRAQADQGELQIRVDLYDRRSAVYSTTRDFGSMIASGNDSSVALKMAFGDALNASRFLFGPELQQWLRKFYAAAVQLDVANTRVKRAALTVTEEQLEIVAGRYDQFNDLLAELDGKFAPYLGFGEAAES